MCSQSSSTRQQQIDDASERLSQAFDAIIGDPDQFRSYLEMVGRMYHYSWNNVGLIFAQCEHASLVGSYKHWQDEGRQVRKGEQSIKIFAPVQIKCTDLTGAPILDADGNQKTRTGFRLAPVFDISQTDGPQLPVIPEPTRPDAELTPAQRDAFAAVIAVIQANRFTWSLAAILPDTAGCCEYASRSIVVNQAMPAAAQMKTTIHEAAHMLADHTSEQDTKAAREAIAEGTAFVVCAALGLDTSAYSPAYIAAYVDSVDRLRESMARIKTLAGTILDAIQHYAGDTPCPNCDEPTYPSDAFCGSCGHNLYAPQDPPPATPSAMAELAFDGVTVMGKDLTAALKSTVATMRKTSKAADRRKNPTSGTVLLLGEHGALKIKPFDAEEFTTIYADTGTPVCAVLTLDDAYALAQTLDKDKTVRITQNERQTVFAQESAARGRIDTMAFNPAPVALAA